jgi:hypothetical protein
MATVATHAQNIIDLAADADALIAQLGPILENIEAEENGLHVEAIKNGPQVTDAIDGRRRLAHYAQGLVFKPQHSQTVTQLATAAWGDIAE